MKKTIKKTVAKKTAKKVVKKVAAKTKAVKKTSKKAEGIKLGRPIGAQNKKLKLTNNSKRIQNMLERGCKQVEIARIFHVQPMTLSRFIKKME